MEEKTRQQLIKEERAKLIKQAVADGFYKFEIAKIFRIKESRISQILKSSENKKVGQKK